ncbi:MAG TPA: hypothetical protein DHW85_14010 [Lachnospiraceae bacterium]|jgi:hypothetical protein|nr:hypothetical protein [Lachnospiraceae bacterium]
MLTTGNLNDGEVFMIKDLYKGYMWNRIQIKDRLLLGTLFLIQANLDVQNIALEKLCYKFG